MSAWRDLSLDAKVVAVFGVANWFLLFANHTTVAATRDVPLWQLFPPGADAAFLIACGTLAFAYPFRDHRSRGSFTTRARVAHLAALIAAFVIIPTIASIVLRETGKPYTYIHDGALMVEEASRKFVAGMNPTSPITSTRDVLLADDHTRRCTTSRTPVHVPGERAVRLVLSTTSRSCGTSGTSTSLPTSAPSRWSVPRAGRCPKARHDRRDRLNPQLFPFVVEGS